MATWIQAPAPAGGCCECRPAVCDECCPSITAVECRTKSASKTKCGYTEYAGHESTPPKYYLTRSLSGDITETGHADPPADCSDCLTKDIWTYSGNCTYPNPGCASLSSSANENHKSYIPCATLDSETDTAKCNINTLALMVPDLADEVYTATTRTITGNGDCVVVGVSNYEKAVGAAVETLSNEYTTGQLYADTDTAMNAAGYSGYGSCDSSHSALYSKTSDDITITLRLCEFRITFSAATPSGCRLVWDIFLNGVFYATAFSNISSGITSYSEVVYPPGFGDGPGAYTVDNFTILPV